MFDNFFNNASTPTSEIKKDDAPKSGDYLIVSGYKAKVDCIFYDPTAARHQINLIWPNNEKSRVYLHDEGKTWKRASNAN